MDIIATTQSHDGATKFLLKTNDGHRIEAVFLAMAHDGKDSLCISSQVGCNLGCTFCATGLLGLLRNLSADEIVDEVETCLSAIGFQQTRRFDLSYMGMGEPLRNLVAVLESKRRLQGLHPDFRFYVSTVGFPAGVREITKQAPDMGLQISVHAAADHQRERLIPISRAHPLSDVLDAAEEHAAVCDKAVTLNYCLMAGVNDSLEDAHLLAERVLGRPFRVQVVKYNAHDLLPYQPSDDGAVEAFIDALRQGAVRVHYGLQLGRLEGAGCGQLDAEYRMGELRKHRAPAAGTPVEQAPA